MCSGVIGGEGPGVRGMGKRPEVTDQTRGRAKDLRSRLTCPERRLWSVLRNRDLAGMKFVRQAPIGPFIADFVCREKRLVIELDGESHCERGEYDRQREAWLRGQNYTVCRIANDDVLRELEGVLIAIVLAAGLDAERWRAGEYGKLSIDFE